jgi:hypothetical protein
MDMRSLFDWDEEYNSTGHSGKKYKADRGDDSYVVDDDGAYERSDSLIFGENGPDDEVYRPKGLHNVQTKPISKVEDADNALQRLKIYMDTMTQMEAAERMKQTMIEMDMKMSAHKKDEKETPHTTKCVFDLPDGFMESDDTPHMYVTDKYPDDPSNIFYLTEPAEAGMQCLDKEGFRDMVEDAYEEKFGELVDVQIDEFTEFFMDRYRAFRVKCSYDIDGIHMSQLEYIINAEMAYVIIYTMADDVDRMDEFEKSAATIRVERTQPR